MLSFHSSAPFLKTELTKFTEVGIHGLDTDRCLLLCYRDNYGWVLCSMVRDLVDVGVKVYGYVLNLL